MINNLKKNAALFVVFHCCVIVPDLFRELRNAGYISTYVMNVVIGFCFFFFMLAMNHIVGTNK
jgi:hypothetical protein